MKMSSSRNYGVPESDSALGPLIGLRRPRYEILHDVLGEFISAQNPENELYFFVNLNTILRQLFSEHAVAKLTRGEFNRHPRQLAAELLNVGGHYRNFAFKHYGRRTTVIMYYSSEKCEEKLALNPDFKSNMYAKRIGGAGPEFDVIRNYVNFNLETAKKVAQFIPHLHLVDTGAVDPEPWPWALASEGRLNGSAIVLSSWAADLQYALGPGNSGNEGYQWAVLRASGDHSRLITRDTIMSEALRETKTGEEVAAQLEPGHYLYTLAMAGEDDLGVPGIPKFGMSKAAKHIAKQVGLGRMPGGSPNLAALSEEGGLDEGKNEAAALAWKLLVHQDYASTIPSSAMSEIDTQLINRSGLAEIEKTNATFFEGRLSLELLYAGEGY
jgi:hypothetical protein